MTDSCLLIDQGNTRLKWVWARGGEIVEETNGHGDLYELDEAIRTMDTFRPGSVFISSVAGLHKMRQLADFCRTHWRVTARFLESRAEQGGVRNGYDDPETLGVDRWLAIVGAASRYGTPVVIWDLGTASTLDAVNESGQHLGGMIYPGPQTMLDALRSTTELDVPPDLAGAGTAGHEGDSGNASPGVPPGLTTADCIGRGVLAAQLGALNQYLRNVSAGMACAPKLVVTGGASDSLLSLLDFEFVHDPWLVFRGMLVGSG